MFRHAIFAALLVATAARSFAQTASSNFRISGRAVNAVNGRPLSRAEVSIGRAEQFDSVVQKLLTGDDGGFSFAGLEPGKYWLAGQGIGFRKQGYEQHGAYLSAVVVGPGLISENLVFRLRPDSSIAGAVHDDDSEPIRNAIIYLFRADASRGIQQTFVVAQTSSDDRGYYRFPHLESGWYFIAVAAEPWFSSIARQRENAPNPVASERAVFDMTFPVTLYPGVIDPASATKIVLTEGEDYIADFTLTPVPGLRVQMNHLNADPQQPSGATLKQNIFGTEIVPSSQGTMMLEDSLTLTGIPPGKYLLDAQTYGAAPSRHSTVINLTSDMELDANAVAEQPAIHGAVRGLTPQPQTFIRLLSSHGEQGLDAPIAENGEFSLDSDLLAPGTYSVFVMNGVNGENSIINKLTATGAKVTGQTIQITGSTPIELIIELSHTLSTINGVARRAGKPIAGAMILLVPENPEINLPLFRRDQTDSDGTFTLHDVLPGHYKIVALDDMWDFEWGNTALLKTRLDRAATTDVQPNMTYQTAVNVE